MKKALSVLLAVLLLVACVPTAIIGSAAEGNTSKYAILSDGATLISETVSKATSTTDANASFTVTLPAGGWIQYKQSLPGLIVDSSNGDHATEYVQVKIGDNTATDLAAAKFNVQLTDDATAKTDIVPVAEKADGSGENPGTDAMSWFILGSGGNLHYGKGANTVGGPQICAASHTNVLGAGVRIAFSNDGDKVKGYIKAFAKTLTSTKTKAEVGLDKELYVRLRNSASEAVTYTFTVHSASISTSYKDGEFILSDLGSTVDSVDYAVENGVATIKYTATLSGVGSYVQFDKKLTDLIGGTGYVNVAVGDSTTADYQATKYWVQLTDDATAAADVAPIQEKTSSTTEVDPGTDAMTWFMYGNGNYVIGGRGLSTAYFGTQFFVSSTCQTNGGMKMSFTSEADGKVGITTPLKTAYYPSYHTAEDVGIDDGAYVRIRNGVSAATTYTVTVVTKATPYTDGVYKFSDEGSGLLSTSRVVAANGEIEETATVMLSGNGGYVQLDRLLKDIITKDAVGDAQVKVIVGDGTADDYANTNVYFQLTADKDATKDIVPVDEKNGQTGGADPGTDGITWRVIKDGTNIYLRNGGSGGGYQGTYGVLSLAPSHGLPVKFTLDSSTGKVSVSHRHHTTNGYAKYGKPSTKTLADIGGENGVYVRIRNGQTTAVKYTIVVNYKNLFANTTQNGTVTLDKAAALTGDTVKATVTADEGYQLKAGSLKYTVDGSKYYPITARVGEDESVSNVFAFAMPEDAVNVTAEFVAADAANHALLGAAYNIENGEAGKDMRFGSRAYRKAGDSELISCGNYLLRADSTLGAALTDGVELTEQQLAELINPSEGQFVKRVPTSVLNDRCDDYVDYTVRIVGVADGYEDVEYVCVSYANYRDAEGNVETVYSAPCIRSYNQLINAAQ